MKCLLSPNIVLTCRNPHGITIQKTSIDIFTAVEIVSGNTESLKTDCVVPASKRRADRIVLYVKCLIDTVDFAVGIGIHRYEVVYRYRKRSYQYRIVLQV
jgi:hypothetical protein